MLKKIVAVVVHHRSYDSVGGVIEALLAQGISCQNILVVDNSEEPDKLTELRQKIDPNVQITHTPNRGYAAAVNHAIGHFLSRAETPEYFLVSTHEARPSEGAVAHLQHALEQNPRAAVAGPTLISGIQEQYVWSTGGYIDAVTGVPAHHDHRSSISSLERYNSVTRRSWLDGAFLLYRWKDISERTVPEDYFLYMEETDLHLSMGKSGREVVWVPQARVWQQSGGIPPFYFARNIRIFLRAHGGLLRAILVPPLIVTRRIVGDMVRRRGLARAREYLRGLFSTIPRPDAAYNSEAHVHIVNPLGAALLHYENELGSVLREAGYTVSSVRVSEPSASGANPLIWIANYIKTLVQAGFSSHKKSKVIVTWPVLGYLDVVLLGLLGLRDVALVMHDPQPLVRSVGYSRVAQRLALLFQSKVQIVAHSNQARAAIGEFQVEVLPHPILHPAVEVKAAPPANKPLVRVLGQYKNDRDLEALRMLGREVSGDAVLEIHGRGWPPIEGWRVFEGFVEEEKLDVLMAESAAILIPYKRFFQSGIAVRALEVGTPFVGPRESVLAEMLGHDSGLLVDGESTDGWKRAVAFAMAEGAQAARHAGVDWREKNIRKWSAWMKQTTRGKFDKDWLA